MISDQLEHLLKLAIQKNATDIHLNFSSQNSLVQFRTIFGLESHRSISIELFNYLKYLAKLDLSATTRPQSGIFSYIINDEVWHCRFSALETFSAKSGVLRILNLAKIKGLDEVTRDTKSIKTIRSLFKQENGLILFSGATGSGKSTTMFTALNEISDKSIYTLEDPIECLYTNMMQIQINEANHLDFQEGIKQLLRHDPDVIVLGEVRSPKEAQALIRTCLSGHLVCATIHANSADATITRLCEMGCSVDDLKMINLSVIHQKLVIDQGQRTAVFNVIQNQNASGI